MAIAVDDAVEELAAIESEVTRRKYLADPVLWAEERLGDKLWSGQQRIARALQANRRVAVKSCHEVGKSWLVA